MSDSRKELIGNLLSDIVTPSREDEISETCEETTIPPQMQHETRDRKLTEKGKEYQFLILNGNRNTAHSRITKQIKRIYSLLDNGTDYHSLEVERENLDKLKEEFNEAHAALYCISESDERQQEFYRFFDLLDRSTRNAE